MNTRQLRDWLHVRIERASTENQLPESVRRVRSFQDAAIFTALDGLVIELANGEEFQLTVTQTRYGSHRITGGRYVPA